MLAMGRALMSDPKLVLMDEPSLGLSPIVCQEVARIVREIHARGRSVALVAQIFACVAQLRAADTALFLVDQNARAALAIADRGYVLETGSIVLAGTGAQLLADAGVRSAYLGL